MRSARGVGQGELLGGGVDSSHEIDHREPVQVSRFSAYVYIFNYFAYLIKWLDIENKYNIEEWETVWIGSMKG